MTPNAEKASEKVKRKMRFSWGSKAGAIHLHQEPNNNVKTKRVAHGKKKEKRTTWSKGKVQNMENTHQQTEQQLKKRKEAAKRASVEREKEGHRSTKKKTRDEANGRDALTTVASNDTNKSKKNETAQQHFSG